VSRSPLLARQVAHDRGGERVSGHETIGHEPPYGDEPTENIESRCSDSQESTLGHLYALGGEPGRQGIRVDRNAGRPARR
jgi:hypothetical protein